MARILQPNAHFALEHLHDARLSPDGRRIACALSTTREETGEERFEIAVLDRDGGSRRTIPLNGNALYPRWSPDGRWLAFVGMVDGTERLHVANAADWRITALTPRGGTIQGPADWSPDGARIAILVERRGTDDRTLRRITRRVFRAEGVGTVDERSFELHVLDLEGSTHIIPLGLANAARPAFSPSGNEILILGSDTAFGRSTYGGQRLFLVDLDDARIKTVLGDRWSLAAVAWLPSGKGFVVAGAYDSRAIVPTASLWVVDHDGSNPRCRTEGYLGNVGLRAHHDMPTWGTSQLHMLAVADDRNAYATVSTRGRAEIWKVALEGPTACEPVARGERTCVLMDVSAATSQLLYGASDLHRPWDLYASNLEGRDERRITDLNHGVLARWPPMAVEHLSFSSNDGMLMEGWHLRRADRAGPQPTVMFIHGGPMLATGHVFRFDFHLLAANGFAVLFANFRGSEGYGNPFVQAIVGDWGARGFPDHMAAVDAAIERGLAEPARLGVWGASHGGFATAWIVGHTERFRAAVAESSVTNFTTAYYLSDAPDMFAHELGGRPDEIPDLYRARSPLTYASRCRTPTLLLHGTDDLRCPMAEAEQFYRALHDAGCVTELVPVPGMNHMGDSVGPLAARRIQNEALLDWFERHL